MNGIVITRHAAHPCDPTLLLCGREVVIANDEKATTVVDVGSAVNCPGCRVTINFVRRCISVQGYTLHREYGA